MLFRITVLSLISFIAACAQPTIPDTPAGRTLKAWLGAFNSGERAQMEAYLKRFDPSRPIDGQMNFRSQTGGFDLLSIDRSEPTQIDFRVKEKNGPTTAIGRLEVKAGDPGEVVNFGVRALPPGATEVNFTIDAATRQRVIDGAVAKLNEFYVFPDIASKMEQAIRARQKAGEYDAITNGDAFATKLTTHLREVSRDKHLNVNFSPAPAPRGVQPAGPDLAAMRRQMERMNCGFEKAERLPPNIGYLKFNMFGRADICGPTATAAMNFLGNVDALIIDLRENGGGDPQMVAFVSSYLFDERTHLNDLYSRKENKTEEFWTTTDVPGKRFAGKPVFVLTAARTFSGAEEFAYNLKNLKRATIIGETTGGGAHPVSGHRIDDRFMIGVPFARAINPISKTNWEGTGVEPDVKVAAAEALEVARKLATKK